VAIDNAMRCAGEAIWRSAPTLEQSDDKSGD
jgi:hypothetical protein